MKKLILLLCIFWCGFIFYNSGRPGEESHKESTKIVEYIQKTDVKFLSGKDFKNRLDFIVRKNAHAFEYIVLAILVGASFFAYDKKGKGTVIYILFFCLFYAVTDEFHQSFVPGRTSLVSDILIDFGGTLIGMLLFYQAYYKLLVKKKVVARS